MTNVHPYAQRAAEAAEAAGAQGSFWEMHDLLFENQDALEDEDLARYAASLGLDARRLISEVRAGAQVGEPVAASRRAGQVDPAVQVEEPGLERALAKQTAIAADLVIANYRTPLPTVREAQWRMAREALAHAVSVRPGDTQLKASLRYCDGHLHRINGEARKSRRQTAEAQHEFTDAVTAFREAAELRPNWPDPFLGLTRTFIYGLEDVDRAADALKQAQRFGYTPGDRETAQLGDGYRTRAETLARTARTLSGMAQEQEYLARAAEAYRQAVGFYSNALGFAGVARNLRVVQRGLTQVEQRIADLSRPIVQPGAPEDRSPLAPESVRGVFLQ